MRSFTTQTSHRRDCLRTMINHDWEQAWREMIPCGGCTIEYGETTYAT
ncbi:hypothetical protein A2U01_0024366, partial [Trifolium medium]|nr:hypothetical protein [Trifolium medium]